MLCDVVAIHIVPLLALKEFVYYFKSGVVTNTPDLWQKLTRNPAVMG